MSTFGRRVLLGALSIAAVLGPGRVAWAHGGMNEPTTTPSGPVVKVGDQPVHLEVRMPSQIELGSTVSISAVLTDMDGHPISGATIFFERPAFWGDAINGHMLIGSATTDHDGVAMISEEMRTGGESDVDAVFAGDPVHAPGDASGSFTVVGDSQLSASHTGLKIPWLNLWALAAVIALVWGLYFVVGLRILAIVRSGWQVVRASADGATTRRHFLTHAVPYGAQAAVGVMGAGLIAVVARSPRTHGNLMAPPQTGEFSRSPVARIGQVMDMPAMPEPLRRPVSFSTDVLPIFQRHGGPHIVRPASSPPPGGLMLDSYEHLMAKEGVVVPGKPEASELIEHLLSVGMQMPPSVPPLPSETIQIIVTWIAQGAKDD